MKKMKKLLLIVSGAILFPYLANAGGIVTNTNQSAAWVRTLNRDASTGIDAAYFNPAGLVKLDNGFHFSLNSQTIFQSKDVTATYPTLIPNPKEFKGDVKAPVFPSVYAAWKLGKFAVSFGFNPIGGGGGAEYNDGLFSFEKDLSLLRPTLATQLTTLNNGIQTVTGVNPLLNNITGYNADIYFKGTSTFFGYQLGLSYKITDMLSVSAGARYVTAKNTYTGHIQDITIDAEPLNPALGGTLTPGNYIRNIAEAMSMQATLNPVADYMDTQTADREVDVEEKGSGFAPILGANVSLLDEKLNVGLKYEFKTKLELETTIIDNKSAGLFIQDSTVYSDMPAMLSIGASFRIIKNLTASAGFHYYFDKSAKYGKTLDANPDSVVDNDAVIDNNYLELSVGLEYGITENFFVSAGYLYAKPGVSADYQSDLSYSLPSSTIGGGFGFKITEKIILNLGVAYSIYQTQTKEATDLTSGLPYSLEMKKNNLIMGIGLDFSF